MARTPKAIPPKSTLVEDEDKKDDDLPVVVEDEDEGTETVVVNGAAEESVESLRAQLAETNARLATEASAREAAERQLNTANDKVVDSNLQVIENALGRVSSDKKSIQAEIKAAKEAGDYDAEIEAIDKLQALNVQIARLNEGKNELERRNAEAEEIAKLPPVEQYVRGMPQRSADWVRAHADYVTDPVKKGELEAAHFRALGARLPAGTPQYFEFLETELGLREDDDGQQEQQPTPRQQQTTRPPAAPVSRSTTGVTARKLPDGVEDLGGGKYKLSPTRREYARISGLSDAEYLKNLLDIEREGALH